MDVLTFFLLLPVFAVFFWLCLWRYSYVQQINLIPGPPELPLFGNIFALPKDGPGLLKTFNIDWVKTYGHVYRFWRGVYAIVNISSAPDLEGILTSQRNIEKSITGNFFKPWIGEGLLLAGGKKWKKDRKLLTPAFHFQILDGFFDVFNRNASIFVEQIKKKLLSQKEIDIYPMSSMCTLDIICEAAMGIEINAQVNSDSEYIVATDRIAAIIQGRINSILGLAPDWFYYRFTSQGRKLQSYLDLVHGFTLKVMKTRKAQLEREIDDAQLDESSSGSKKRRAFLDLLLEAAQNGADLSEKDIMNQVDTFMFEGHDTTSAAVTWFLYCMATHQHEQDRVFQELYECFGDSDRPCTLEDIPKLKYLECCIKEAMRLYPPVAFVRRRLSQATVFSGHLIPVRVTVGIQIYAAHRNEEYFPDAESFKPERFLPENSVGRHPFAYVPFSAGPRNCIGQKFAMYEDKVIVSTLLRNFRFDLDPRRYPIKGSLYLILKPEGGMPLLITPR